MTSQADFIVDALEYSKWDRDRFMEWRTGNLDCVHVTLAIWEDARDTIREIAKWRTLFADNADIIQLARTGDDIRAAKAAGKTAVVFGLQNTAALEDDLEMVGVLHQLGVRIVQLTYNIQNLVGGGCWETADPGVSAIFGKNVLRELNAYGMLIDLSHCGERTTLDAIELSDRPVAITHANPIEFVGSAVELSMRNKSSKVLRALTERGGVVGLSMYPRLAPDGPNCTLQKFSEMVAWTIDLVGADHVGIGTDLYVGHEDMVDWWRTGRFARESVVPISGPPQWPAWMQSPAQFAGIADGLAQHGLDAAEIAKVMGGNWVRFFSESFMPMAG